MRFLGLPALAMTLLALAGCDRQDAVSGPGHHGGGGRYQGIGIYPADQLWPRLSAADTNKDQARALRADDGQIIIVVDTRTGEVRQCGNLSGYCVSMNPWSGPLAADRSAPVSLSKHAAELANEASAEPANADAVNQN